MHSLEVMCLNIQFFKKILKLQGLRMRESHKNCALSDEVRITMIQFIFSPTVFSTEYETRTQYTAHFNAEPWAWCPADAQNTAIVESVTYRRWYGSVSNSCALDGLFRNGDQPLQKDKVNPKILFPPSNFMVVKPAREIRNYLNYEPNVFKWNSFSRSSRWIINYDDFTSASGFSPSRHNLFYFGSILSMQWKECVPLTSPEEIAICVIWI